MGFFKKAFGKSEMSEEEKRARMGNVKPLDPFKGISFEKLPEEEKLRRWARAKEIPDVIEKIGQLEVMANAGYEAALISLVEAYHEKARNRGRYSREDYKELMRWAGKAAEYDLSMGHFYYAMLNNDANNPEADVEIFYQELAKAVAAKAVTLGCKSMIQFLAGYYHHPEEEFREAITSTFDEILKPVVENLLSEGTAESEYTIGFLYYQGVYFRRDLEKAKEYLQRSGEMGLGEAKRLLQNPIFEEEEEE